MKISANFLVLAGILFVQSTGQAANNYLELVLSEDRVSFTAGTNIEVDVVFRNIGETNLAVYSLLSGLSVVWDGKEYMRNTKRSILYQGPPWLGSEQGWHCRFLLADYSIPSERLVFGRHTVAVRDKSAESNTLTIFIEPVLKPNPNVKFGQTTTSDGIGGGGSGGGGTRVGF